MRWIEKKAGLMRVMRGLRDRSKRDPSTSRADFFAGAKKRKKRRPAPVGMTVGCLTAVYCGLLLSGCIVRVVV
jgi:hypothetical protein